MNRYLESLFQPPSKLLVLALLRILLAFHLIKDLFFSWTSLALLYSNESFLVHPFGTNISEGIVAILSNNYPYFIMVYVLLLVLFLFGIGKNITVLLIYIFLQLFQRMGGGFVLDGGDDWLKFLLFYFIFADSFQYLSLAKKSYFKQDWLPNLLTNLAVFSIMLHFSVIYFFSGFYKINSDLWFNGTANYYIFQLERFHASSFNDYIASSPFLSTLLTYAVLLWEIAFPFLIWQNKTVRNIMMIIGLSMHMGIYFLLGINDFEMLFIFTYLLFFKDDELRKVRDWWKNKKITKGWRLS